MFMYDILFLYLLNFQLISMVLYFKNIFRKILKQMKIGTHNGSFHCDEALACTMLRNYTAKFKNATVVRSRDPKVLDECDVVVDVGGKYEPPRLLDHHQIQFTDTYPNFNIRLSSAGLVYLHFGEQIISNVIKEILQREKAKLTFEPKVNNQIISLIKEKVYEGFIIYVDANDNGVSKIDQKQVAGVPTTLWSRVSKLNPMWWEEGVNQNQRFEKAMEVAGEELVSEVRSRLLGSLQTKSIVKEAFLKRKQTHPSGKVVFLQKYVPWVKPIYELEVEQNCVGQVLFVIFPQKSNQKFRIQTVPQKQGAFEFRKGIKEEWRGIKDMEKLRAISEIEDIEFVHATGFIGGAVSRQSVVKMAELSL